MEIYNSSIEAMAEPSIDVARIKFNLRPQENKSEITTNQESSFVITGRQLFTQLEEYAGLRLSGVLNLKDDLEDVESTTHITLDKGGVACGIESIRAEMGGFVIASQDYGLLKTVMKDLEGDPTYGGSTGRK